MKNQGEKSVFSSFGISYFFVPFFVLFAFYITVVKNDFYLKWAEGFSLFLFTPEYFKDCMQSAGGLLSFAGTFLMQFFRYPLMGSAILIALLFLVQYLTMRAFRFHRKYYPLSFIPGLMLLLSVVQLGYVWVTLKSPGYFFSNTLGVIIVLLCLIIYRQIKTIGKRSLVLFLFVVLGYPLFGFYALFAATLSLLREAIVFFKDKNLKHLILIVFGVLLIVFVPRVYFYCLYDCMQLYLVYWAGLPRFAFDSKEFVLWFPFIVLFLFLLFSLFLNNKEKNNLQIMLVSSFLFCLSVFCVYSFSYKNENFRAEIKTNNAIENDDMKKVITIVRNLRGNPTKNILLNYQIALLFENKSSAKKFNRIDEIKSIRADVPIIHVDMGWRTLLYQTGIINDCYRWCMEDMVEYKMRISTLKYLVKCAIVNEEYELANKYNSLIAKTLFDKDWATEYQAYIDNPQLIIKSKELRRIRALSYEEESFPKSSHKPQGWKGKMPMY